MTTTDDSSLRIRLEGGLEVIEQSTALLGTLRELTATRWELRAAALRAQLERWRTERAGLDEALARARALPEATAALDRYEAASTALVARLSTGTFEGTDVHRAVGLQPKLSALEVLAAHTGERHDRAPLASAEREERLPLLVPGGLLTVLLALAGHWPWVAACAVLTGLAWQASARRTTWRVFADRLEVARASGPVLATPLTSAALQALPALGDTAELAPRQPITVASVRRLVVPDVEELEPVLAVLAQLRSEVDAFERQEAALRAQDPTMTLGTWVRASLRDVRPPSARGAFDASPVPVFRYADRSKPIDGQCVVLEDGLLFVAAGAEDWAREIVLGSAPTLRSRTLDALPVQPIRAKLEQLRESPNTTWVAFAGVAPWGDSTNGWRLTQEHHVLTLSPTAVQRAELLAVRDRTRDDAVRRGP